MRELAVVVWLGSSWFGVYRDAEATLAWKWTYDQLVDASMRACAQEGDAAIRDFELRNVCDIDGTCRGVEAGTITVGIRPVRLSG